MRLVFKSEFLIVPKGTKFAGPGKLGLMISNALERSKNIPAVISLLFAALTILSTSLITAIFVECLGRKPNWFSKRILCLFKKEIHLFKYFGKSTQD